jgi:hypothetical protein
VNEYHEATSAANGTVSPDHGVAREGWRFGASREFNLLQAGDFYSALREKVLKLSMRVLKAVDV